MESCEHIIEETFIESNSQENCVLDCNISNDNEATNDSTVGEDCDVPKSLSQNSLVADNTNISCLTNQQTECTVSISCTENAKSQLEEEESDIAITIPNFSDTDDVLCNNFSLKREFVSSQEIVKCSDTFESCKINKSETDESSGKNEIKSHSNTEDISSSDYLPDIPLAKTCAIGSSVSQVETEVSDLLASPSIPDSPCNSTREETICESRCSENNDSCDVTEVSEVLKEQTSCFDNPSSVPPLVTSANELVEQNLSCKLSEPRTSLSPPCESAKDSTCLSVESESSDFLELPYESDILVDEVKSSSLTALSETEVSKQSCETVGDVKKELDLENTSTDSPGATVSEQAVEPVENVTETGLEGISNLSSDTLIDKEAGEADRTLKCQADVENSDSSDVATIMHMSKSDKIFEDCDGKQSVSCKSPDANSVEKGDEIGFCTQTDCSKKNISPIPPLSNIDQQTTETYCSSKVTDLNNQDCSLQNKDDSSCSLKFDEKVSTSVCSDAVFQGSVESNIFSSSHTSVSANHIHPRRIDGDLFMIENSTSEAIDLTQTQGGANCLTAHSQYIDMSESNSTEEMKSTAEGSPSSNIISEEPITLNKKETGFPDEFEGLVTIGRYVSVKGDFTLRSTEALIESPSLVAPFLLKEPDIFPTYEQGPKPEYKSFFHSSVGDFLVGLGLSRVHERYFRDMAHIKKKQMKKEGKLHHLEQELKSHQSSYLQAKMANEQYTFPYKSCSRCGFSTESDIVLEGHMLAPHVSSRREYQCSYCTYLHRDPKEVLNHMKATHNKTGYIQPPVFLYECPNCIFECNSRAKLGGHISKCMKYYNCSSNQAPPTDFEYPCLTPKPITVAVVKAYEKSLNSIQSRYKKQKKTDNMLHSFQHHLNQISDNSHMQFPYESCSNVSLSDCLGQMTPSSGTSRKASRSIRPTFANPVGASLPHFQYAQTNKFFPVANSGSGVLPMFSNDPAVSSPLQFSFLSNIASQKNMTSQSFKNMFPPGLPQPPKLQGPYPVQMDKPVPSLSSPLQPNSLVVCEICDGYIKDMEQLRTHMQLIHKVKIHPKVLASRPPLNCQKCQWRFFTDQGLERHLLGAHGLVTSNMQELANKSKDAGCCTICGRVFASKLVAHMSQVHKITLKPAHLSYKCTVCSATFNLYRLFENHVYLVHSGASKRPADTSDLPPSKKVSSWEHIQSVNRDKHSRSLSEKENGTA